MLDQFAHLNRRDFDNPFLVDDVGDLDEFLDILYLWSDHFLVYVLDFNFRHLLHDMAILYLRNLSGILVSFCLGNLHNVIHKLGHVNRNRLLDLLSLMPRNLLLKLHILNGRYLNDLLLHCDHRHWNVDESGLKDGLRHLLGHFLNPLFRHLADELNALHLWDLYNYLLADDDGNLHDLLLLRKDWDRPRFVHFAVPGPRNLPYDLSLVQLRHLNNLLVDQHLWHLLNPFLDSQSWHHDTLIHRLNLLPFPEVRVCLYDSLRDMSDVFLGNGLHNVNLSEWRR
mmetsp:Transcript_58487/g.155656  ORF Transcript_58487/g.155656 Transcript_58487/m.155656 type:complete len:283 (+) Transcript_58487:1250-2098(+)